MAVLAPPGTVSTVACDDCPRSRVVATEQHRDGSRQVTILAGCPSCEGSHLTIPR